MRHGWLADVAARREVAGAGFGVLGELANDRQASRVGEGGEQPDLGVQARGSGSGHAPSISANFDIDKYRYIAAY